MKPVLHLCATAVISASAHAGVIYATGFESYSSGTLASQSAWTGVAGTWAVSASVNTGQVGFNILTNDGAMLPPSGSGKFVRMTTSKFGADRTKAWLDLLNSGKWAAASAGGNDVLESSVKLYVPANSISPCQFGLMISKDSATTGAGFVINAQTGAVSYLDGGYAAANRFSFGATVTLGAWHDCVFRWNPTTGESKLTIDGTVIGSYTSVNRGGVYAVNLFSYSDWTGTSAFNAYAYADDYSVSAVPNTTVCVGDFNNDQARDGADLGLLLGTWGTAAGDLNGDGMTNGADLGILLGNWGPCL